MNEITEAIIGAAVAVHRRFGPGLLESAYEACVARHLTVQGFLVERQVTLPLEYLEERVGAAYRVDLLVEERVVVELKAVQKLGPVDFAQIMTYLRLSECQVGLLINFNVPRLVEGIRRVVNHYDQASASASSAPPRASASEIP